MIHRIKTGAANFTPVEIYEYVPRVRLLYPLILLMIRRRTAGLLVTIATGSKIGVVRRNMEAAC